MYNPEKSAELKEKFKKLSTDEQSATISANMQKSVLAFMAGTIRSLALGSIFYVALNAIIEKAGIVPFNWFQSVSIYATFEILTSIVKRARG
jgi:hypothetical protein